MAPLTRFADLAVGEAVGEPVEARVEDHHVAGTVAARYGVANAVGGLDAVAAGAAGEAVVARVAGHDVLAVGAVDRVVPPAADQPVVAPSPLTKSPPALARRRSPPLRL
jgi:hypothetical protein